MKAPTITSGIPLNVYLIGNNPIELSSIYDKVSDDRFGSFKTEICFELNGLYGKIKKFRPQCILIDDNLDRNTVKGILKSLASGAKTRNIPVTILKNDNYTEGYAEAQDFLLKRDLTSENLSRSIRNAIRMKQVQFYLIRKYRKNKNRIKNWISVISDFGA